jgi:hypothetical protein
VEADLAYTPGNAPATIGGMLARIEQREAIAADPLRTAAWLDDQREANARAGVPSPRETTAADIPAILDRMRRDLVSSLAYHRARDEQLAAWREVTAPLLASREYCVQSHNDRGRGFRRSQRWCLPQSRDQHVTACSVRLRCKPPGCWGSLREPGNRRG